MKREIEISHLQIGMFVDSVDGSWFSHPFWRRRLLIKTNAELTAFRDSGIERVIIDTDRGIDITSPTSECEAPVALNAQIEPVRDARFASPRTPRTFGKRERAAQTIENSTHLVRTLFDQVQSGGQIDLSLADSVAEDICEAVIRDSVTLINMLRLKNKDEYTYLHSIAVCTLMIKLARQLHLDRDHVVRLGVAGLLHDIGKIAIPLEILNKPAQLTDAEFAEVKQHPARGAAILRELAGVSDCAIEVSLHHHERIDGGGYPDGLSGSDISLPARMGAICDVYDALTSDRTYKEAWSPQKAVTEMHGWDGDFDPKLLFAFFQAIQVYPLGSAVRLENDKLAVVLPCKTDNTPPPMRIFYDLERQFVVQPEDLAIGGRAECARIVGIEDPSTWRAADPASVIAYVMRPISEINRTILQYMWSDPIQRSQGGSQTEDASPKSYSWKAA